MKSSYRDNEHDNKRLNVETSTRRNDNDEQWRIAQRSRPRRNSDTSSSNCSCSSCHSYRRRKEKIRRKQRKERTKKRKRKDITEDWDSDQSGLIAARRGVVTDRYGKYGLITEFDKQSKEQEFYSWLLEIKNKSQNALSSHDERKLFEEFTEEYNTATFPTKKYYDLAEWEAHILKKNSKKDVATGGERGSAKMAQFDDEKLRREEIRKEREKEKRKELDEALETLKRDKDVVDAMRRQKALRLEMDYLFKTGKIEQAREIQALLRADSRGAPVGTMGTGDEEFDNAPGGNTVERHSYRHDSDE